jgi:hypothetical protein
MDLWYRSIDAKPLSTGAALVQMTRALADLSFKCRLPQTLNYPDFILKFNDWRLQDC